MAERPDRGKEADGSSGKEPGDEGSRFGATLGGLIVLILLVAGGIWLMNEFADNARYAKCMAQRHRNCDDINYRMAPEAPPERQ